jgi:iron complex outermembrane receptor protein
MNRSIPASILSVAVSLVVGGQSAQSQSPGQADSADESGALQEIIVTAQRRSENLQKTPVAIAALGSEALRQRSIVTESDLQLAVPGLTARQTLDSNDVNYAIRGQTYEFATGSQVAVQPYVNEVPVTSNAPTSFYDLQSIQVLKGPQGTLFGKNVTGGAVLITAARPTSEFEGYVQARAGNYALRSVQGALNIPLIKDNLLLRVAGDLQRRHGFSYNLFDGRRQGDVKRDSVRGTILVKPTETLNNMLIVDYGRSRGSGTPSVLYSAYGPGSTNNGIPLNSAVASLYSPALDNIVGVPGAWDAFLAAHPGADPDGLVGFLAKQKARSPFLGSTNFPNSNRSHGLVLSNVTTLDVSDGIQIKNIFGYVRTKAKQGRDFDGSPFDLEHAVIVRNNRQYSDEIQLLGKAFDERLSYVVGAYYSELSKFDYTNVSFLDLGPIIPVTTVPYISVLEDRNLSVYAQGTYDLSDMTGVQGLGVTVGGRYTSEKVSTSQRPGSVFYNAPGLFNHLSTTFKKVSWQFGIQEQVSRDLLLYAVTRRSFRTGGFNIYAPPLPGTAEVGGSLFKPEIAQDVELGAKYQGRLAGVPTRLNIAVYKQWVDNIQRTLNVVVPNVGVSGFTANVPQAQVYGLEGSLDVNPLQWLEFGADVAYTHAKFTKNAVTLFGQEVVYGPYPDTPRWSGSAFVQLGTDLPNAVGRLSGRAEVYAQTGFYFSALGDTVIPGAHIPGYKLVNFRVGLDHIADSGLSIAGYVKNAFDKRYFAGGLPIGSALSANSAIPGDRRTMYIEASYKF